jgi:hypothetical protein
LLLRFLCCPFFHILTSEVQHIQAVPPVSFPLCSPQVITYWPWLRQLLCAHVNSLGFCMWASHRCGKCIRSQTVIYHVNKRHHFFPFILSYCSHASALQCLCIMLWIKSKTGYLTHLTFLKKIL